MLRRLSWRNAKRQLKEYALFFVTLTCAVAALYAFHALIFSKTAKALPDLELLPYLIAASSLLIVLILGWVVSYMMSYMLKRRSREFSIYMRYSKSKNQRPALPGEQPDRAVGLWAGDASGNAVFTDFGGSSAFRVWAVLYAAFWIFPACDGAGISIL